MLAGDLVRHARDVEWVVNRAIPTGSLILVAGYAKLAHKTIICTDIGLRVSVGEPCFGLMTQQRSVYYYYLEDGWLRTANRLKHGFCIPEGDPRPFYARCLREKLPEYLDRLRAKNQPLLVIVDPLVTAEIAFDVKDENDAREIDKMFTKVREFAQATNSTVIMTHHFNKQGRQRGSTAIQGSGDGWVEIDAKEGDSNKLTLKCKLRDAEDFNFTLEFAVSPEGRFTLTRMSDEPVANGDRPQDSLNEMDQKILALVRQNPVARWSQPGTARALGVGRGAVRDRMNRLKDLEWLVFHDGTKGPRGYGPGPKLSSEVVAAQQAPTIPQANPPSAVVLRLPIPASASVGTPVPVSATPTAPLPPVQSSTASPPPTHLDDEPDRCDACGCINCVCDS